MSNKIGVFLSGGGGKGPFQIVFFKALEEIGIKPDIVCGSSVGALVAGASTYMSAKEMLKAWQVLTLESVLNVDSHKIVGLRGNKRVLKLWKETFIACATPKILIDTNHIRDLLYQALDAKKIMNSSVEFGITTTELPTFKLVKKFKSEMSEENVLEYILASMYLPIFRPQKIINNKHYLDIADLRKYPLEILKGKGCSEIYIVNISPRGAKKMNKSINYTKIEKEAKVMVIDIPYKASILDFSEEKVYKNYKSGYETTMKILNEK